MSHLHRLKQKVFTGLVLEGRVSEEWDKDCEEDDSPPEMKVESDRTLTPPSLWSIEGSDTAFSGTSKEDRENSVSGNLGN